MRVVVEEEMVDQAEEEEDSKISNKDRPTDYDEKTDFHGTVMFC